MKTIKRLLWLILIVLVVFAGVQIKGGYDKYQMALADRLNQIVAEQRVSKREFAKRVGISENYLYVLTGNSRSDSNKNKTISRSLAKLIAIEFGYDEEWVING